MNNRPNHTPKKQEAKKVVSIEQVIDEERKMA